MLEAVVEGVGGSVFYSAIWECVAVSTYLKTGSVHLYCTVQVNTTIRLPALTFVLSHLARRHGGGALETQQHILGADIQVNYLDNQLIRYFR